jgi:hypothetical protein
VSFPLSVAGDCFEAALEALYGPDIDGADPANRCAPRLPRAGTGWLSGSPAAGHCWLSTASTGRLPSRPLPTPLLPLSPTLHPSPHLPTPRTSDKGFRTAPLIRLVGAEDGLLSQTHDGPRVFLNMEDYLYYKWGVSGGGGLRLE